MKYTSTLENGYHKDLGISYLKGILHTYQSLNQPDSTLSYDYNIVAFEKGIHDTVEKTIKQRFEIMRDQSFELDLISDVELRRSLTDWFFETKFVSDQKVGREVDFFYKVLKEITGYNSCYLLTGLDSKTFSYDLGIYYQYFLLKSEGDLYLLYFSFSD